MATMDTVEVTVRQVYGADKIYPANDAGRFFCTLTGNKTLRPMDIGVIRNLGFEVRVLSEVPEGLGL